ncbi:MAG: hypothetical protein Athens101410_89 [Parcubacteria group bacterium Athens1014_10]|nr:MAG: hypothetical protein Athens101410_89 [Parcubacteria group bacterium Athens1014_10]TSD05941.1 MAG: hypothetical protein Athens071412_223 [Parcubacteria group bacterium Athens0714_12]
MALPSKKRPRSEKRKRAFTHALKKVRVIFCPKCKKAALPYHACAFCGVYAGREILKLKLKKDSKAKKNKKEENK